MTIGIGNGTPPLLRLRGDVQHVKHSILTRYPFSSLLTSSALI
jgi:hypothetical protein